MSHKFSLKDCVQMPQLPNDFVFWVASTSYSCNQTLASIHCRIVRLLVTCDPTAQDIVFPYDDPKNQFGLFTQFINGGKIHIDQSNYDFLTLVANYFQCDQLLNYLSDYLQQIFTPQVAFMRASKAQSPVFCQPEIKYLATRFWSLIDRPEWADLPLYILDAILSSKDLAVNDLEESSMMAFITDIIKKRGNEYVSLYSHIVFEGLERQDMQEFVSYINHHREDISGALWQAIAKRLVLAVVPEADDE